MTKAKRKMKRRMQAAEGKLRLVTAAADSCKSLRDVEIRLQKSMNAELMAILGVLIKRSGGAVGLSFEEIKAENIQNIIVKQNGNVSIELMRIPEEAPEESKAAD